MKKEVVKNQKYSKRGLPDAAAKIIVDGVAEGRVAYHTEGYFDCRECPVELFLERHELFEDSLSTKEKELLDCIENLMGVFDTPVVRMKIKGTFATEAREVGREILNKNGRNFE